MAANHDGAAHCDKCGHVITRDGIHIGTGSRACQDAYRAERETECLLHDGCPASCEYRGALTQAEADDLADTLGGAPVGGCDTWAASE